MSALPVAGHGSLELTDNVTDQASRAFRRHACRHTSQLARIENICLYIWIKLKYMHGRQAGPHLQARVMYILLELFQACCSPNGTQSLSCLMPHPARRLSLSAYCKGDLVDRVPTLCLHAMFVAICQHLFESADGCCVLPLS